MKRRIVIFSPNLDIDSVIKSDTFFSWSLIKVCSSKHVSWKNFDNRPLLNQTSKKTIDSQLSVILRNREKFYKECSLYVVDTDNSKPNEILVRLLEIIKNERI